MGRRVKASFKSRYWGVRPWTRHSLVLLVAGLVYIALGISYATTEETMARTAALEVALQWAPLEFWGAVFILTGLSASISARYPPVAERWGYTVLTGLSAGWSAVYALGVIVGDAPAVNINGALLWGLVAFLWWAISGLLNPPAVFRGRS